MAFQFNSNNANTASSGFSLNSNTTASTFGAPQQNQTGGLFGKPTGPSNQGGFSIGQPSLSQTSSGGAGGTSLFGGTTSNTASGGFGAPKPTTPVTGSGLFGQPTQPTTGGLFGQTNNTTFGGSSFGNQAAVGQSTNNQGPFGQTQSAPTANNSMFNKPSTGLFGQPQSQSFSTGSNMFGQQQQQQQQPIGVQQPLAMPQSMPASLSASTSKRRFSSSVTPTFKGKQTSRLNLSSARLSPYSRPDTNGNDKLQYDVSLLSEGFLPSSKSSALSTKDDYFSGDLTRDSIGISQQPGVPRNADSVKKLVIRRDRNKLTSLLGTTTTPPAIQINGRPKDVPNSNVNAVGTPISAVTKNEQINMANTLLQTRHRPFSNPVAVEQGYWCEPSLEELYMLPTSSLAAVPNFRVGRRGYAQVEFLEPVDLTSLPEISDVLGIYVAIDDRKLMVYPEQDERSDNPLRRKPPVGHGLNQPAIITLENVFARDPVTKRIVTDRDNKIARRYEEMLRAMTDRHFVSYILETGIWVFKVDHFTIYSVPDYDDDFEERMMADSEPDFEQQEEEEEQEALPMAPEDSDDDSDFYDSVEDFQREFLNSNVPAEFAPDMDDADIEVVPPSPSDNAENKITVLDRINDYSPDIPTNPVAPLEPSSYLLKRSMSISSGSSMEYSARPISWLGALQHSSNRIGGLLDKKDRPLRKRPHVTEVDRSSSITGHELGQLLLGDSASPVTSLAATYREAAMKLRLPPIRLFGLHPRFSPGCGKLALRSPTMGLSITDAGSPIVPCFIPYSVDRSERNNGLPLANPCASLSFSALAEKSSSSHKDIHEIWPLASILFDNSVEDDLARKNALSTWLESQVGMSVQRDLDALQAVDNQLARLPILLSGHCIGAASRLAMTLQNDHLATVVSLMGAIDDSMRSLARDQLQDWLDQNSIYKIPTEIRHVYELLAGNTSVSNPLGSNGSQVPVLYLCNGLDWKRAFGLKLWYGLNGKQTIVDAVIAYTKDLRIQSETRVQAPAANDILFSLIKLYALDNSDIRSLVESTSISSCVAWYLYLILCKSNKKYGYKNGDKLAVYYGDDLESHGFWKESIFIYSHISDDDLSLRLIKRSLFQNIESIAFGDEPLVAEELHLPVTLIYEGRAQFARYREQHKEEAEYLIRAGLYDEAHSTIVKYVAPQSVLSMELSSVFSLLQQLENKPIANWAAGGQIYLDYITLAENKVSPMDSLKIADRLCSNLSKVQIGHCLETQVAIAKIANFVGKFDIDSTKLLQMKTNERGVRQQTIHLAAEYLRKKVECA